MMYIIFDLKTLCFFAGYSTAGGGFPSLTFLGGGDVAESCGQR